MRMVAAVAALVLLTACTGGSTSDDGLDAAELSAAEAVQQTCELVRAGIDEFNRQDYLGTVEQFVEARIPAKKNAEVDTSRAADDLLEAVEYYANLAPEDYPEAAASSERFARNKAITLDQCASGEPLDEAPRTEV